MAGFIGVLLGTIVACTTFIVLFILYRIVWPLLSARSALDYKEDTDDELMRQGLSNWVEHKRIRD
ncbi:hypothetical protein ACFLRF_01085 [Candidatus Altiarchaeota archaeon]